MKTVLLTGSCGFIGSHLYTALNAEDQYHCMGVDALIGAHSKKNYNGNFNCIVANIADKDIMDNIFRIWKPTYVIHCAAESFVDDSIASAIPFIQSNVFGTQVIIDCCLKYGVEKLLYISTDEIYGQLDINAPPWKEKAIPNPRNPYSASKYAGEVLVRAAHETHGLQFLITRSCNNFGPRQQQKNLIPRAITNILAGIPVPVHGNGTNIREWIYVEDNVSAILTVLEKGAINHTYNIGSGVEKTNLALISSLETHCGKAMIEFIPDRKGHDKRYSINCDKIHQLGWRTKDSFGFNLMKTVRWYIDNQDYYV